jgi:hypothetical protein
VGGVKWIHMDQGRENCGRGKGRELALLSELLLLLLLGSQQDLANKVCLGKKPLTNLVFRNCCNLRNTPKYHSSYVIECNGKEDNSLPVMSTAVF